MNLRQLEYFETVSGQRSFRQAARALGLAEPTLSVQIKQLEHELGVPLFDRRNRPIRLTKAGEMLQRRLPRVFNELNELRDELADMAEAQPGRVVLGVVTSMAMFLPSLMTAFAKRYPNITVELRFEGTNRLARLLKVGEVDTVLTMRQPDSRVVPGSFHFERLFSFDYVFAISPEHRLAAVEQPVIEDLRDERFIIDNGPVGQMVKDVFHEAGLTPQVAFETNDARMRVALAANGGGIALIPEFETHDALGPMKTFRMAGVPLACDGMLLWSNQSLGLHSVNAFVRFATTKFEWAI